MAPPVSQQVSIWETRFFRQYVRGIPYSPYMGRANGEGALMPILINRSLERTSGGKTVNLPYVADLKGDGVQGTVRLAGNEEELATYNQAITVNYNRHAVVVKDPDERFTGLELRDEARMGLQSWATRGLREDLTTAFMAYDFDSYLKGKLADNPSAKALRPVEAYTAIPEAKKNAFLAANSDRFLFGAATSNHVGQTHAQALTSLDYAADRMSTSIVSLAKEIAESTDQAITPWQVDEDEGTERWVLFVGTRTMRDLMRDPEMRAANRDARIRGEDNPIFRSGDLMWEGVIIRQIRDIPVIRGVGAAGGDVQPAFLCGAGAVGAAWGQRPVSKTKKEDDYDFEHGVGIQEIRGVAKLGRGGVQNGLVNLFVAAPPTV